MEWLVGRAPRRQLEMAAWEREGLEAGLWEHPPAGGT